MPNIYTGIVRLLNVCGGNCLGQRRSIGSIESLCGAWGKERDEVTLSLCFLVYFFVYLVRPELPCFVACFTSGTFCLGVLLSWPPCGLRLLVLSDVLLRFYSGFGATCNFDF